MVLPTILHRGNTIFFFEYVLKIALARKAEVAADFGQRHIGIIQKAFGFFQPTFRNIIAQCLTGFFLKEIPGVGHTASDGGSYIVKAQGGVHMIADVGHTGVYLAADARRQTHFSDAAAEIQRSAYL